MPLQKSLFPPFCLPLPVPVLPGSYPSLPWLLANISLQKTERSLELPRGWNPSTHPVPLRTNLSRRDRPLCATWTFSSAEVMLWRLSAENILKLPRENLLKWRVESNIRSTWRTLMLKVNWIMDKWSSVARQVLSPPPPPFFQSSPVHSPHCYS